jgi:hypothetical protein
VRGAVCGRREDVRETVVRIARGSQLWNLLLRASALRFRIARSILERATSPPFVLSAILTPPRVIGPGDVLRNVTVAATLAHKWMPVGDLIPTGAVSDSAGIPLRAEAGFAGRTGGVRHGGNRTS